MKVVHYFCDFCKKDMSDTYTQLEDVVIEGKHYEGCRDCRKKIDKFKDLILPADSCVKQGYDSPIMNKQDLIVCMCSILKIEAKPEYFSNGYTVTADCFRDILKRLLEIF